MFIIRFFKNQNRCIKSCIFYVQYINKTCEEMHLKFYEEKFYNKEDGYGFVGLIKESLTLSGRMSNVFICFD